MAEQIGFEFTAEDRKLLESMARFSTGLDEMRADSKRLVVDVNKAFRDISKDINDANKKASQFKNTFAGILAADLVRQGVQGVKNLFRESINAAEGYEQLQVAFGTFLGDTAKANKLLEQLTQTAANTPFQQDEIFQGARQLLAYGIEAEKVNDLLTDLGDISAGVSQPLSRIVNVFGQITAKGKLTGEELRQLREAGVNPIEELAQVLGVAGAEIEGLISKGKVSSEAVAKAFKLMTSEGGRFNDLMEKQSETFGGVKSNFIDTVSIILRQFGEGLIPTLKEGLKSAIAFLKGLDPDKVKAFGSAVGSTLSFMVSLVKQLLFAAAGFAAFNFAKIIAGIGVGVKGLTSGITALTAAVKANPLGFLFGTVVALLPQLITLVKRLSGVTKTMEEMKATVKALRSEFLDEVKAVEENLSVLKDLNSTQKERQRAIDNLAAKYPDIIAKYDLEKGRLTDIIDLQRELKDAIIERLKTERIAESQKQLQEDLEKAATSKPFAVARGKSFSLTPSDKEIESFRKSERDKAVTLFQERNAIIEEVSKQFEVIDIGILAGGGSNATQLQKDQTALDAARSKEKAYQAELSKFTDQQLRDLSRSKDVDEVRKKLAIEILKARADEANKNAANKKDLEKAQKALEKYRDAVQKIAEDVAKSKVENITNPFLQLAADKQLALDQLTTVFSELRKQGKEVGADLTEIEKLETEARLQIDKKYYEDLKVLKRERREQDLNDFIEFSRIQNELNAQALGKVPSDGINTSDELTQISALQANKEQLAAELDATIKTFGIFATESLEAQRAYNQAVIDLNEVTQANREAALDREEDLLLAEIDLLRRSGDSSLTLEEFKGKKRLEIQKEFAIRRLELLQAEGFGENSPEVKQIRSIIAAYENALKDFGKGDLFDKLKDKIADIFKIDRGIVDQSLAQLGSFVGNLQDLIVSNTEFQIDQQQIVLDTIRDQIQTAEEELRNEEEDKRKGYSANVDDKKKQLDQLRAEEKKHQAELLKQQKTALKNKLAADALSQISSLVTMVSNVVAAESGKGLLGIATGLTAITGFLLMFKTYKNQSKALAEKAALYKGGKIPAEGYTDHGGGRGHRIEGTNIRVGGGEMVVNRETTEKHDPFLKDLNDGKYDHLDLHGLLKGSKREPVKVINLSKKLAGQAARSTERAIQSRHAYEHRLRTAGLREAFSGEISRLIHFMDNQEQVIPWSEEMAGYIIRRKGKTIKRKIG